MRFDKPRGWVGGSPARGLCGAVEVPQCRGVARVACASLAHASPGDDEKRQSPGSAQNGRQTVILLAKPSLQVRGENLHCADQSSWEVEERSVEEAAEMMPPRCRHVCWTGWRTSMS